MGFRDMKRCSLVSTSEDKFLSFTDWLQQSDCTFLHSIVTHLSLVEKTTCLYSGDHGKKFLDCLLLNVMLSA